MAEIWKAIPQAIRWPLTGRLCIYRRESVLAMIVFTYDTQPIKTPINILYDVITSYDLIYIVHYFHAIIRQYSILYSQDM